MNLKYYLRGLGLGIVMTAIIMGIATHGKDKSLTEEEIIEKAKTLGMIEEDQLEEYLEEARAETEERVRKEISEETAAALAEESRRTEAPAGQEGAEGQEAAASDGTADIQEPGERQNSTGGQGRTEAADGTVQAEDVQRGPDGRTYPAGDDAAAADDATEPEEDLAQEIIFTIKKGETPYSIGKRLEEEGLLPEDANFDRFLVDNGYDMKVVASEYHIPIDADMETIAKIITKQR